VTVSSPASSLTHQTVREEHLDIEPVEILSGLTFQDLQLAFPDIEPPAFHHDGKLRDGIHQIFPAGVRRFEDVPDVNGAPAGTLFSLVGAGAEAHVVEDDPVAQPCHFTAPGKNLGAANNAAFGVLVPHESMMPAKFPDYSAEKITPGQRHWISRVLV